MQAAAQKQLDGGTVPTKKLRFRARRAVSLSLSGIFSAFRALSLRFRSIEDIWRSAISEEVGFWDKLIGSKGGAWPEDFNRRMDPNTEVFEPVSAFVKSGNCKILDVGAGPLTLIGKKWHGQPLDVTAVDALATEYDKILARHGVVPLVRTQQCEAEKLSTMFSPNTFDITNAQNCLDHAHNPVVAIEQMFDVTKHGGTVCLVHGTNEGAVELYRGLHQWNFKKKGNDFLITSPGLPTVNMSERFAGRCEMQVYIRPSDDCLVVTMTKK